MRDERQPARLSRKYGRWQALWFGLPLGAVALGVFTLAVLFPARLSPGPAILIGLALYLIVALIAGYRYCHQRRHEGWESGWAGFRLGLVAAALFMLVMTVWMVVAIHIQENTPPPPNSRVFHSQTLDVIVGTIIFGVFAVLNGAGMLLSAIGARIGGALAIWRTKPHPPTGEVQEAQV